MSAERSGDDCAAHAATGSAASPPADVGFRPDALEIRLQPLERLGRSLWLPAIIHTESSPLPRLAALSAWRDRLFAGDATLDPGSGWPGPDVAEAFNAVLTSADAGTLCRGQAVAIDQLQRQLLWHVDRLAGMQPRLSRAQAVTAAAAAFQSDWMLRGEEIREVLRLFESLDGVVSLARWSELSGLLRSSDWQAMLSAHRRMSGMPRLAALIRQLGRSLPRPQEVRTELSAPQAHPDHSVWTTVLRESHWPGAALETEGIRRSGDLGCMLASEAMLLRGRRRLLAARAAEQTLLTYHHRDRAIEAHRVRLPGQRRSPMPRDLPRLERGPMIVCVDTSASMAGPAEQIAKAIVLEAARVARLERRDCLLYAFSGPGNLARRSLAQEDDLFDIVRFLAEGFHGGTDVCDLVEAVLDDLEQHRWQGADLLIATDGEFGAPRVLLNRFQTRKAECSLSVQGVLIADRQTIGMKQICDDIFWVRDWRRHGEHAADSPVHSAHLTALYFPSAFRSADPPASHR